MQPVVGQRRGGVRVAERLDQRVGAAPGGVLLQPGGDVGRAHHARSGLAAGADVHAAVRRAAHPADHVEVEGGAQRAGLRQRGVAEVVGHRRRVDDLAGVHHVVGVEERLDLAHRLVQVVAEDLAVELAARQAVAVLAGVDPAVLADQVLDLDRDRPHRLQLRRVGEVHERPHVQAAHRSVPVEPCLEAVPVQHLLEALGVDAQVDRVDRRVLDERERAPGADRVGHQQPEARLAHLEQRLLLGGGDRAQGVVAVPVALPERDQPVEPVGQLVDVVAGEGHEQQRRAGRPRGSCRGRRTRSCSGTGRGSSCPSARPGPGPWTGHRPWRRSPRGST